jgi:ABC-type glutathione transport system ATPase component
MRLLHVHVPKIARIVSDVKVLLPPSHFIRLNAMLFVLLLARQVAESGDNMSAGQKQLLCLARAILQRNKILVMDEASSSIDTNTDVSNLCYYYQYYRCQYALLTAMCAVQAVSCE